MTTKIIHKTIWYISTDQINNIKKKWRFYKEQNQNLTAEEIEEKCFFTSKGRPKLYKFVGK